MKNILVLAGAGANHHIRTSLVHAWQAAGFNVFYWNPEGKSAFDAFAEFNPDLFLGDTWQLSRAIVKSLNNRPNVKTILYSDIWGEIQKDFDVVKYPVGIATDEQKKLVDSLHNIPFLITNHSESCIEDTHGGWRNLGCKPESVLVSADITQYYPRPSDDKYAVQLFYCGGSWNYKNSTINRYLTPLFYPNTSQWKIRVAGGGWNSVHAVGMISVEDECRHYSNAQFVPHMTEPHVSEGVYADIPLRYFQVPACNGFGISCPGIGLRELFTPDELVIAENPQDFFDKVVYFLNKPEETIAFRNRAREKVLTKHTGFHRIRQLMQLIDEPTDVIDKIIAEIAFSLTGY